MADAAGERFAMIPMRAASLPGLTGTDYRVLIVISSHARKGVKVPVR
jgi:hypothetical protein